LTGIAEIDSYVRGVKSGQILACTYVHKAIDRHEADLKRNDVHFSVDAANHFFEFMANLRHYEGKWAGNPIKLEPWQKFVFGSIFGWVWTESGNRRYREVFIEIPKKNGKSLIAAGIALYLIMWDNEAGAQVYGAATSRLQAKELSFRAATEMIKQDEDLDELLKITMGNGTEAVYNGSSFFKPLTAKPKSLDGFNVHGGIFDEVKDWETDELFNIIADGTASREQPIILSITTAGHNQESLGYQLRDHLIKVLDGTIQDDRFFGIIYTIDEGDEDRWDKLDVWEKANPNFGVSVNPSYFESQMTKAGQSQTKKNDFLTKHLNVWVKGSSSWMDMTKWKATHKDKIPIESFKGQPALMAVDLAASSDMCSVYIMFVSNGKFHVYGQNFLPQSVFGNKSTKYQLQYRAWEQEGKADNNAGTIHRL